MSSPAPPSPETLAAVRAAVAEGIADAAHHGRALRDTEAAARLGIARATVWRLVARGHLRPVRIGGSTRFPADQVAAIARRGTA